MNNKITIKITGAPGTGKSQIAERIHHMLNEAEVPHHIDDSRSPSAISAPLRIPAGTFVQVNVEQH